MINETLGLGGDVLCSPDQFNMISTEIYNKIYNQFTLFVVILGLTVVYDIYLLWMVKLNKMDYETYHKRSQHSGMARTVLTFMLIGIQVMYVFV